MKHSNSLLLAILFLCLIVFGSCEEKSKPNYTVSPSNKATNVVIPLDSIKIVGDLGPFSVFKESVKIEEGVEEILFSFSSEISAQLSPVSLQFNFPSVAINGFWNPNIAVDKVNYYNSGITAKAARYAPILAFYNNALENRITFALSDALNQSEITSYLKEEDVHFYPEISLFKEKMPKTSSYQIRLRIDTRSVRYNKAISDVSDWWANHPSYKPMPVPAVAKKPMYSTWYSYHQDISAAQIIAECKIAKRLGCEALIVDDGWQTKDGNRGYAFTGDWTPNRIPNMKEFVDGVHAQDMKFILWYSLPFMGEKAKNYEKFKGKYLRHWESQGAAVLDPRYPEVRKYIIQTYIKALNDWKVDGFKLDFIGWFTAVKDTQLTKANGRDYASVNEATDALMTKITRELTSLKPDILIEFRQPYIGPLMRKYGNMFRGVDAPNNAVANKIETTNLRLMAGNTAVHSDMFIWRSEEPTHKAALQILNILFSVPQLSVRLEEIPEEHLDMIKYWFTYWNKNSATLLDGQFLPSNPGANYPQLTAISSEKQITALYEHLPVYISEETPKQLDIINATANTQIIISSEITKIVQLRVTNCKGEIVFEGRSKLKKGVQSWPVPESGMISISRE